MTQFPQQGPQPRFPQQPGQPPFQAGPPGQHMPGHPGMNQPQQRSHQAQKDPRDRRGHIIIGVALAVLLFAAGGLAIMRFLSTPSTAAAAGIPESASAVFEINLAPSAADQLELKRVVDKFPALQGDGSGGGSYKEQLWNLIPDEAGAPPFSEVEPWLGDSVAFAMVEASGSDMPTSMVQVLSIDVKDDDAAMAFADEYLANSGMVPEIVDDLMVMYPDGYNLTGQSIVDAPITDSDNYKADMNKLGGSWLATAWFDTQGVAALLEDVTDASSGEELPELHGAMGIKADDETIAMRYVAVSDDYEPGKGRAARLVGNLPKGIFSLGWAFSEAQYETIWEAITEDPDMEYQLASEGFNSADDLRAVLGDETALTVGMDANQQPTFGLAVKTPDPDKHNAILQPILQGMGIEGLDTHTDGNIVYTSFGMSAQDMTNPAERVKDSPDFDKLTQGSGDADLIVFMDVAHTMDLMGSSSPEMDENLQHLSSVGIVASNAGGDYGQAWVRVGVR